MGASQGIANCKGRWRMTLKQAGGRRELCWIIEASP
jgi:hypothetical protein